MMTIAGVVLTVLGVSAALTAERSGAVGLLRVAKPAASAGFILAAIGHGAAATGYGQAILVGLGLSMVGDVLLMWRDKGPFRAGILAFLAGHVAYVVAFSGRGIDGAAAAGVAVACGVAALIVLRWLLPHVERDMRAPVLAYVAVISVMLVCAVSTHARIPSAPIVLGAVGFYLSDLFVARERFVVSSFANRLLGLPLYYAAQHVLAWTTSGP